MRQNARAEAVLLEGLAPKRAWWRSLLFLARSKPLGTISALVLLLFILMAIFADFVAPFDPQELHLSRQDVWHSPSSTYLLGTDALGRDILSRIIYGSRLSLYVGFAAVGFATLLGSVLGLVSGYFGGVVDAVMQRIVDSWMAFPALVLAMAIMTVFKPSAHLTLIVIGIVITPLVVRIARGATTAVKNNVYVEAARALGASDRRILFKHILPNVLAPIIVIASVLLGGAIIVEASLAFLGLGAPPDVPSWGQMIQEGRRYLETAWWLAIFPGVAISITVFSFNLLGDAIRDVLDPKLRGTGAGRFR